jgi:kinesin family protein 1
MAEEAVKVAVRVRPFNKREKEASSKLIVAMTGNTTILTHPQTGEEKKFTYDYSYW